MDMTQQIKQEIYLTDERIQLVLFSGGKDSSYLLTLFWEVLLELPAEVFFEDSSVAFTYTKSDRIMVDCPGFTGTHDPDCPYACKGEICITGRYLVC